jgi:predicted CXXCH cytochrome family protein
MSARHIAALSGIAAAVLAATASDATARQQSPSNRRCVECHLASDDDRLSRPVVDFETDVHAAIGFGCLDCHGPDPTGASQEVTAASGFLSKPTRRGMIEMCGRCHSNAEFMRDYNPSMRVDQVARYATSTHGILLAERNDPNVAVCESCHPAHQVKPSTDLESSVHPLNVAETCGTCHSDQQRMAEYDIALDQRDQYERSVHWTWMSEEADLSAPTCNDCHGNHGAAPPGVASVEIVCGECHAFMADYFGGAPHGQYFIDADLPGCATCHGNHAIEATSDDMLLELNDTVCNDCHESGEAGHDEFLLVRE